MAFRERWRQIKSETAETADNRHFTRIATGVLLALFAVLVFAWLYGAMHQYEGYLVARSSFVEDIGGTHYAMLGSDIIKYSSDGAFCVDQENKAKWSVAYAMQSPITDICQRTMAIAEQQGSQVVIVGKDGLIGRFEVPGSIRRVRVSSKGNVVLILTQDDVTWINLYAPDGTAIASVRTTLKESGYPLDAALTTDARRMMVSFVCVEDRGLAGKIVFYDFSDSTVEDHVAAALSYEQSVFPEVYYAAANVPVAVSDSGFIAYSSSKNPSERAAVTLDSEIVSTFHDQNQIGFVVRSPQADEKYRISVYGYGGKQKMEAGLDMDYTDIRLDGGEVLLHDARGLCVYRTSGKVKLDIVYEKEVVGFAKSRGIRRYLVIGRNSFDQIRIS